MGSALLAAVMVVTCMPQTGLYARAEEIPVTEAQEEPDILGETASPSFIGSLYAPVQDEEIDLKSGGLGLPEFSVDFSSVTVKDKTYDSKPHSISGYALWTPREQSFDWNYKVTGKTFKGESYEREKQVNLLYGDLPAGFAAPYEEIAPVECGSYTLTISVEVDGGKYEVDKSSLEMSSHFWILPLQRSETVLVGVSGIADKDYDGQPYDIFPKIANAKVQTDKGVDISDKVDLKFKIFGKTEDGTPYEQAIDKNTPADDLPKAVGQYMLYVSLVENDELDYLPNEWTFPFAIKRHGVTVTVIDQERHVSSDAGLKVDDVLPGNIADQCKVKGLLDADLAQFYTDLKVAVQQNVDFSQTGIYDLAATGINAQDWSNYDITYVAGKLRVKAKLTGIKGELKDVTNVTNGLSLAQIAEQYLPKKTTIYLRNGIDIPENEAPDIEDSAEIIWDTSRPAPGYSYKEGEKKEQTFKMQGTITVPELVYADEGMQLTVIVGVSVREAYEGQALKPYADVQAGTVAVGTKVTLATNEGGAQIYYTVQGENPSLSLTTRRLYKEPIEITNTMTIRAISSIYGKRDSEELRLTYYLDKTLEPGGSDPDDPDNPTVPDEDIPKDDNGNKLPIPEDLWVTDVTAYVYTGKVIKPEVRVYDHKKLLEEKKDYTISYKNNTNAADKNSEKAPTITIKGKGNYEGTLLKKFTIAPKDIRESDVKADNLTVAFNNKAQKPVPVVTWNGKKLSAKRDYVFDATPQTAAGTYEISLKGTGNYTGERKISFIITNGVPVPKLTVGKITNQTYTGEEITPEPVVKNGKELLVKGKDYTVSYEDNEKVGTASVIIRGQVNSRYVGEKRVTFAIKEAAVMNKAKVDLQFEPSAVYTGKEIVASRCVVTVNVKIDGVTQTRTLEKDKDYKVTYQNNIKAGKATAVFEGINAYKGTLKKTFKISAYDLQLDQDKKLQIQTAESYPYMKNGSTPKPVVKFGTKTLKEGTDYTVSYKNHTAAGNVASMTITGKGNFAGRVVRGYNVGVQDIANMTVKPADKVFKAKANIYKTKVQVLDSNGKALSAGKDYDKNVTYTYTQGTDVEVANVGKVRRKAGDLVEAVDIIPAGAVIRVTVNAAGSNYQGMATGTYRFVRADIAKAKVSVPPQTYTGKAITLEEKDIVVSVDGMSVSAEEYTILESGYVNNVNKGTAKLTIQGKGNYGGTKTVTFKIKGKGLLSQIFG